MRQHSEKLPGEERVLPMNYELEHVRRMAIINEPFPKFNIIKTSYAGASRGMNYPGIPLSERAQMTGSWLSNNK